MKRNSSEKRNFFESILGLNENCNIIKEPQVKVNLSDIRFFIRFSFLGINWAVSSISR